MKVFILYLLGMLPILTEDHYSRRIKSILWAKAKPVGEKFFLNNQLNYIMVGHKVVKFDSLPNLNEGSKLIT